MEEESDSETFPPEDDPFSLGAEEIVTHTSYGDRKRFKLFRNLYRTIKPKRRRHVLIRCTHPIGEHFSRAQVERALETNQIAVMMNTPEAFSLVWCFCGYPEIDNKICTAWVVCTLCRSMFAYLNATTSGAKRHLETKHLNPDQTLQQAASAVMIERAQALNLLAGSGATNGKVKMEIDDDEPPPLSLADSQIRIVFDQGLSEATNNCTLANFSRRKVRRCKYEIEQDEQRRREREERGNVYDDDEDSDTGSLEFNDGASQSMYSPMPSSSSSSRRAAGSNTVTSCSACQINFNNVALAMLHQSAHDRSSKFACAQCHTNLGNVFDFWAHLYSRSCSLTRK